MDTGVQHAAPPEREAEDGGRDAERDDVLQRVEIERFAAKVITKL